MRERERQERGNIEEEKNKKKENEGTKPTDTKSTKPNSLAYVFCGYTFNRKRNGGSKK